ncbi:MAG: hypothetical protein LRZ85_08285 [Alphaproteobacteria bacterium]|nr:hypothetical protein [Alphaproteobacteria bacterium]MCD8525641.1 hypothetical protein [Alphaproteobacteria bacterium]MCD8570050.1 hypothetical protein [Alphaproteobacteria bacterium]
MQGEKLTITFNNLNEQAVKRLGRAVGRLVQNLYREGYNLHADPKSGHQAMFVCVDGEMASGKSTLSSAILTSGINEADMRQDCQVMTVPLKHDLDLGRDVLIWESWWSLSRGQQDRVRDCWVTNPFRCDVLIIEKSVPDRILPGIEILEHAHNLPQNMRSLEIKIDVQGKDMRGVTITLPQHSARALPHWNAFRQEACPPEAVI